MRTIAELRDATLKARAACRVDVCTQARAGRVRVGYFIARPGRSDYFVSLSDWISVDAAIGILAEIEMDGGF